MSTCHHIIGRAPHVTPDCNLFCPEYCICDLQPFIFNSICCLEQSLSDIQMCSFYNTISPGIVTTDANVSKLVMQFEIGQGSQEGTPIIGNNFPECTPMTYNVLVNPVCNRFWQREELELQLWEGYKLEWFAGLGICGMFERTR